MTKRAEVLPTQIRTAEQAGPEELRGVFFTFALARGAVLADVALEAGELPDTETFFRKGLDVAELHREGYASMKRNHDLLERVGKQEEATTTPAYTVCVPVAILQEETSTVISAVNAIREARRDTATPVEVVIWANAKYYGSGDQEKTETGSAERYGVLREALEGLAGDGFGIRTALQVGYVDDITMSKMRSNYMDAVLVEAVEQGYSATHPVIWLDADTTYVSGGALEAAAAVIRDGEALFAHADLRYTLDWAAGRNFDDLDDASKAVAINEIYRRRMVRGKEDRGTNIDDEYVEECGLAFGIGTYLWARGIDTTYALGEAFSLLQNAQAAQFETDWNDREYPAFLRSQQLVRLVPSARVGFSARRHYEQVRREGVSVLEDIDSFNYGRPHSDIRGAGRAPKAITRSDLRALFGLDVLEYDSRWAKYRKDPEERERLLAKIADRQKRLKIIAYMVDKHFPGT